VILRKQPEWLQVGDEFGDKFGGFFMPKLTQRISDTTIAPASGQLIIRDEELKGFGLRVTPQKKTYIVDSRVNGVRRRVTIGRCDLLTLEEARLKARQVLLDMASGIDPTAEKRNEKIARITLIELLEEYLQVRTLKASTASVYRRVITIPAMRVTACSTIEAP
jgi:hypothetical protein